MSEVEAYCYLNVCGLTKYAQTKTFLNSMYMT